MSARTLTPRCLVESRVTTPGITKGDYAEVVTTWHGAVSGVTLYEIERPDGARLTLTRADLIHPTDCENH